MILTLERKLDMYRRGWYKFKAPPVCTGYWDTVAWVKWIDACNGWLPMEDMA